MKLIIFANKDLLTLHAKNQIALLTIPSSSTITPWGMKRSKKKNFIFLNSTAYYHKMIKLN